MHVRRPDFAEPAHRVAEELELVDGLLGPRRSELGWPVGGQHDERHPVVEGFDDGGKKVCSGGPRRAREQGRATSGPRKPEREEGCGALVDADVKIEPLLCCEREGQGGRARAGSERGMGDTVANELVDERQSEGLRGVVGLHSRPSVARRRASSCAEVSSSARHLSSRVASGSGRRTWIAPSMGSRGSAVTSPSSSSTVARPHA